MWVMDALKHEKNVKAFLCNDIALIMSDVVFQEDNFLKHKRACSGCKLRKKIHRKDPCLV